jgi:uncharacterized protein YhdP
MPPGWGAPPMPTQQMAPAPQLQPQQQQGNVIEELKAMVASLAGQVRALSRKVDMIATIETVNNRALYNQQAQAGVDPWSIDQRLAELNGPIPPQ